MKIKAVRVVEGNEIKMTLTQKECIVNCCNLKHLDRFFYGLDRRMPEIALYIWVSIMITLQTFNGKYLTYKWKANS